MLVSCPGVFDSWNHRTKAAGGDKCPPKWCPQSLCTVTSGCRAGWARQKQLHRREDDLTLSPRGVCGRLWWFLHAFEQLGPLSKSTPAAEVLTCSGYARHRFQLGDLAVTRPLAIDYVVRRQQQGPERFRGCHGLLFQFRLERAVQVARGSTTCRKFRESTAHFPCSWTCLLGLGHSGKPRVFPFGQ